jgi:thioredoxin reductase (NADPH)
MAKPVILTVDDEPEVLNAIERDLRQHFAQTYRVIKAGSGSEALNATRQLKQRGSLVALFLVDQKMPNMSGTQFLAEAIKLFPDARRVLLTAYAETQAAIEGINTVGLDYYLLKPWEPPQERLYPALDDLLSEWHAKARPPYDGLRVAGTALSASSYAVKDFLSRNQVPYQWVDLDNDASTRELVLSLPDGMSRLPVVIFPDGTMIAQPTPRELAEKIPGMQTRPAGRFYDLVVIGGGPAGLAAAVYGASEGLTTILVERHATGGQAGTSSRIENYLGFPNGIAGIDLAARAHAQALKFGAEILIADSAARLSCERKPYAIEINAGKRLAARAVIIATGAAYRKLQLENLDRFEGAGVYYAATPMESRLCDSADVIIVGGGNSAGQAAMFLSDTARSVHLLIRGDGPAASMSRYLIRRIEDHPSITVHPRTEIVALEGDRHLERVQWRDKHSGTTETRDIRHVFSMTGAVPTTTWLHNCLALDARGFIKTGSDLTPEDLAAAHWPLGRPPHALETSLPGVFAVGDVRSGSAKRVASAVGEGANAVMSVHQVLAD